MSLEFIDWAIIILYLLLSLAIGLYYRKRASKSLTDFFLGGRNLPWHIAGISMVATTFAADTPLAVTELVGQKGISGNWLWWNFLFGGMLTTFFFARLWRRSEILTEVEFLEFRYGGPVAAFLRGFKSIYLGLFMNSIIVGWVNVAMISILQIFFDIPPEECLKYVAGLMILTAIYSSVSGLWGVAITDVIQFVIAMGGCIILAIIVLQSEKIGGIDGLKAKLPESSLDFFPKISGAEATDTLGQLTIGVGSFLAYLTIQWWASWYPGAEPGGGGYIAQRIMSAKNEKHSIYATLFFQIAHYCLRPWPWILVGLCSLVLYPELSFIDKKLGYVMAMREFLPSGLRGLLLVAFLAAYMSTISTQLNWGSSYLINDFYKRFFIKKTDEKMANGEKKLVNAGRFATILTMAIALYTTTQITSISSVWTFIIECGAGLGLVLILRWYWWRINAWSELTATIAPFIIYGSIQLIKIAMKASCTACNTPEEMEIFANGIWYLNFPGSFFLTVGLTTIAWLMVTFVTKPETEITLLKFYTKVKPGGLWGPFSKNSNEKGNLKNLTICWISSITMTYSILFFTGKLIFKEWDLAIIFLILSGFSFLILRKYIHKTKIFED